MSEGMGMGREVGACRLEGRDVGRRSARRHGNVVDVVVVEDNEKVFTTKTGWDGEATGQVGGRPVFAWDGNFPAEPGDCPGCERGVEGEGAKARAGAGDGSGDGAKNGIREDLTR